MSIYAATGDRAARQVGADVFVLVWGLAWWWASRVVHDAIDAVAAPSRWTRDSALDLAASVTEAGDTAADVPLVGDELAVPFGHAAGSLDDLAAAAAEQVATIERVADIVGWVVLLLPILVVVALWLPVRVRFVRSARAARRFIDAAPDLDLFALRAMATQPMPVLARISGDPVRAWREGDRAVITQLAEVELRRVGLRLPTGLRSPGNGVEPGTGQAPPT